MQINKKEVILMKKELYIELKAKFKNINTNKISVKKFYYKYLVNEDVVDKAIKNKIFKENPYILPFYLGNVVLLESNERISEQELKNIVFENIECTKVVLAGEVIY